jgi:hypothetical protein
MLVWATSASVLIGSTPLVACRCANGHVKLFCFSSTSAKSSCCCGGTCCFAAENHGCCHKSKSGADRDDRGEDKPIPSDQNGSDEGPSVVKKCCNKTLVQVKGSTLNRPETRVTQSALESLDLLAERAGGKNVPPTALRLRACRIDALPPPTDLIISLQRLTI